jgi:ABC-type transport system involved in multi-copper enzyme maturation permease subunit
MADVALDTRDSMPRVQDYGPFRGLGGLTGAEFSRWLPWRALTFTMLGLALIAAMYANWLVVQPAKILGELIFTFFILWTLLLVLTTVAATQGMVATEIAHGTAAWVVAKPVGKSAFVISKFVALVPVVIVAMVGVPGLVARYVFAAAEGNGDTEFNGDEVLRLVNDPGARDIYTTVPDVSDYLGTLGLLSVILLVVAAVMVLLGCVLHHPTAILAIGLLVPIAMLILTKSNVDHQIISLTPAWLMESFVESAGNDPAPLLAPILVGVFWIVGMLGLASWWFSRREL